MSHTSFELVKVFGPDGVAVGRAPSAALVARRARLEGRATAFEEVLASAMAGHPWAFEQLYLTNARPIMAYLRSQGAADAEGSTNDVFLRAFQRLDRFRGNEPQLRAWLFTIARNLLIDERRKLRRRPQVEPLGDTDDHADEAPSSAEAALRRLGDAEAVRLIESLVEDQRDVMLLRIVGDLTIEQIATVVGKRVGAVKALQRRGLGAIRRKLAQDVPLGAPWALIPTDDEAAG